MTEKQKEAVKRNFEKMVEKRRAIAAEINAKKEEELKVKQARKEQILVETAIKIKKRQQNEIKKIESVAEPPVLKTRAKPRPQAVPEVPKPYSLKDHFYFV